ncbi:putative F-box/LRR-repeat protein At3g18150 [Euphorbia lathyris]|uniref:putative F-box/LRR-repeat protein At3g18150 n=1 Tax=Euphorbia lathyris TaxID=212925 RepID=UPI00331340B3
MSYENFLNFIDNTLILHDCSKIKKFHLSYDYHNKEDPQFTDKIRFATSKYVEDLYLSSNMQVRRLPEFLFNNSSLIKLRTESCNFRHNIGNVNWGNLKSLSISHCAYHLSDQALEHILSGSPLLELLELTNCYGFRKFVIASKSLKRLVIHQLQMVRVSVFEISCAKLEDLSLKGIVMRIPELFVQAIENVVSGSLLLESFELIFCDKIIEQLVIASKSLKRLVFKDIFGVFDIEISCPKLENLKFLGRLNVRTAKLTNLPSLLCAIIDFDHGAELKTRKSLIKEILQQLHHVKELGIGSWFIENLSAIKVQGLLSSMLNIKCLTLNPPDLNKHHSGIACLLRNSPGLEKLVVDMTFYDQIAYLQHSHDLRKLNDSRKKFWHSNTTVFDCLISNLKTIKIIDFPNQDDNRKLVMELVQFLLNNARVLEKMIVVLNDHRTYFPWNVSQELLSFPRYSPYAIIELLYS